MEDIDTVCMNLRKAFSEQREDPVSLVTIIDMYVEHIDAEKPLNEKVKFLECLLQLLKENPKIVGEIGWDLPKGLLKLLSKRNINPHRKLKHETIVVLVMNCFNEISLSGNPKECLLTGCQLLSELSLSNIADNIENDDQDEAESTKDNVDDVATSDGLLKTISNTDSQRVAKVFEDDEYIERNAAEFFFGLHSYILFELVQTVLRRVSTIYPSKFLGMVVSAIMKYLKDNIEQIDDVKTILRRVYTLCKVYVPPEVPEDMKNNENTTPQELEKIIEDEEALQRKLLRCLCTFAIGHGLKTTNLGLDFQYYLDLTGGTNKYKPFHEALFNLCFRYYQLALSFDIDIKKMFQDLIEETRGIYKSLPLDSAVVNEEAKSGMSQVIYQLSYTYQLQKLAKCKDLELDSSGILILSALYYEVTGKTLLPEIDIKDAVRLYLRFTTPQLFSETYTNLATQNAAQYWLWVAVTNFPFKKMKEALSELPSYLNVVFLQMFLLKSFTEVHEEARMVNFTLLTRILCLMPEDVSFSFVIDTLLTCPYGHAKLAILGILKDLMTKTCHCKIDIVKHLKELNISNEESNSKDEKRPPPPPPRPYISVNEDRMASIHSVALIAIEACGKEGASKDDYILLQSYINFFIALKNKWNTNLLKSINSEINKKFSSVDDNIKEIKFIKMLNESLGEVL